MRWVNVESSAINRISHENNDLFIEYKQGRVYRYKNVTNDVYNQLVNAESLGKFINSNIKGKYEYEELT